MVSGRGARVAASSGARLRPSEVAWTRAVRPSGRATSPAALMVGWSATGARRPPGACRSPPCCPSPTSPPSAPRARSPCPTVSPPGPGDLDGLNLAPELAATLAPRPETVEALAREDEGADALAALQQAAGAARSSTAPTSSCPLDEMVAAGLDDELTRQRERGNTVLTARGSPRQQHPPRPARSHLGHDPAAVGRSGCARRPAPGATDGPAAPPHRSPLAAGRARTVQAVEADAGLQVALTRRPRPGARRRWPGGRAGPDRRVPRTRRRASSSSRGRWPPRRGGRDPPRPPSSARWRRSARSTSPPWCATSPPSEVARCARPHRSTSATTRRGWSRPARACRRSPASPTRRRRGLDPRPAPPPLRRALPHDRRAPGLRGLGDPRGRPPPRRHRGPAAPDHHPHLQRRRPAAHPAQPARRAGERAHRARRRQPPRAPRRRRGAHHLQPGSNPIDIPVHARVPGQSRVDISIRTPDGAVLLDEVRYSVRGTAISGLGLVLSVGAALFLLLWWARHWGQSRRARHAAPTPAAPTRGRSSPPGSDAGSAPPGAPSPRSDPWPACRIVTDSACDLPHEIVDAHGIVVVPLTIRFGDEELTDGVELDRVAVLRQDGHLRRPPRDRRARPRAPSRPPSATQAEQGADAVVCINLSSALSATMAVGPERRPRPSPTTSTSGSSTPSRSPPASAPLVADRRRGRRRRGQRRRDRRPRRAHPSERVHGSSAPSTPSTT